MTYISITYIFLPPHLFVLTDDSNTDYTVTQYQANLVNEVPILALLAKEFLMLSKVL